VTDGEPSFRCEGMMLSLLGTSEPATLRGWFSSLSAGGQIVDELQARPWGASDGQVIDRYGLHWLIGFEGDESP
jgi:PhnB protein